MNIKIALDSGHSLFTAGKRTPDDEREWSFNNKVAIYCKERLSQYSKFEVIRVDDITGKVDVSLQERVKKANSWKANLYISIHQNANNAKWGTHGGTETFYHTGSVEGKKLADLIQKELVNELKLRNRGIKKGNHLYVIRATNMISVLTEGAFMDSLTDINSLRKESELKKQGYAIADGIAKYYGFELIKKSTSENKINEVNLKKGDVKLLKDSTATSLKNEFIADLELAYKNKVFSDIKWIELAKSGELTLADAFLLKYKMDKKSK